ncbi:MAG TPA: HEAT repeat domain-containing protein [Bacteroidota bacterium]|nr:HEAT repeat domain-containing protein [Bacteroidota bacterium]
MKSNINTMSHKMAFSPVAIAVVVLFLSNSIYAHGGRNAIASPRAMAYAYASSSDQGGIEMTEGKELKDDPGYTLYKDGYSKILDEDWTSARKTFAELMSKYPKSKYVEDASYWSAYALRDSDKKKALEAYKAFIQKYPKSTYFDDAIADMDGLGLPHRVHSSGHSITVEIPDGDSAGQKVEYFNMDHGNSTAYSYGFGYGEGIRPMVWSTNRAMRGLQHKLRSMRAPRAGVYSVTPRPWIMGDDDTVDQRTQVKMEALEALGETKEDSTSYNTLKDVALDKSQPRQLRETAMDALANFRKFDALPVFIEVAKQDTDQEIQSSAIDYIGSLSKNKDRSVETLIELYNLLPKDRADQREQIFHSIAEIGNEKAVDFLTNVAKSDPDYEMRSEAVYYLGNIGGDKARAALYEILKQN